jgi:hypothetical protein
LSAFDDDVAGRSRYADLGVLVLARGHLARGEVPHLPRCLSARQALEAFRTQIPVKFDTADEDVWINGVAVTIRDDGRADSTEQLLVPATA